MSAFDHTQDVHEGHRRTRLRRFDNYLGTREHNLARHEDQQDDLRLDHPVDEAGEELHDDDR